VFLEINVNHLYEFMGWCLPHEALKLQDVQANLQVSPCLLGRWPAVSGATLALSGLKIFAQ
jgi:hypothetical protein